MWSNRQSVRLHNHYFYRENWEFLVPNKRPKLSFKIAWIDPSDKLVISTRFLIVTQWFFRTKSSICLTWFLHNLYESKTLTLYRASSPNYFFLFPSQSRNSIKKKCNVILLNFFVHVKNRKRHFCCWTNTSESY